MVTFDKLPALLAYSLFLTTGAQALEVKFQQYSPRGYAAAQTENVLMLSDTPGYRIEDALANGFTVTRVAAITAIAGEKTKTSMESFMTELSSRAAAAGANAIYINSANTHKGSNSVSQVRGDLYRVLWADTLPENLQAGFGAAARLFNTERLASMPYYAKRQQLMFSVEQAVINKLFGLQVSTAASPLDQFSDTTFGELSKKQRKMMQDFFRLSEPPSDDTVVNEILVAGSIENLDIFLGSIKSGLKKNAQELMKNNPAEYAQYRELYLRIYGALPIEDPQADADSE